MVECRALRGGPWFDTKFRLGEIAQLKRLGTSSSRRSNFCDECRWDYIVKDDVAAGSSPASSNHTEL